MKRTTDFSRLRPSSAKDSPETDTPFPSCDAIEQAKVLVARSMEQSDAPIADLSCALGRMAQTLKDIGTPLFADEAGQSASPLRIFHDALARDIAVCIQSLQFHDRLTQQLTQAHALLTGTDPASLRTQSLCAPMHESTSDSSVELF